MSEQKNRERVIRLWELFEARAWDRAGELLHDDLVVEWPHTGERMRGATAFLSVNRHYPGDWSIQVLRVVGSGDLVVSEVVVTVDGARSFAASFFTLEDGRIRHLTEYWVDERYQPAPNWRAPWVERT